MVICDWWMRNLRRKRERKKRKEKQEIDKIGPHVSSSLGNFKLLNDLSNIFQTFENYTLAANFQIYLYFNTFKNSLLPQILEKILKLTQENFTILPFEFLGFLHQLSHLIRVYYLNRSPMRISLLNLYFWQTLQISFLYFYREIIFESRANNFGPQPCVTSIVFLGGARFHSKITFSLLLLLPRFTQNLGFTSIRSALLSV